jgi:ABC-type sulfate/molybdate transport systems ATPase subunit
MDEPLSNLDARLRVRTRAEIGRIQRQLGITTIYVTHDQVTAMTMSDRFAVMRDGALQRFAPPQEIHARPDKDVIVGIRPQNLHDAALAPATPANRVLLGTVELREELGPELFIREGGAVDAVVDTASLHLFDPATGQGIHDGR